MNLSVLRSALNRITVAVNKLSLGNVLVLKVMMTSALLIVFARGIAPFEVGKDQSVQLEAAHRLVTGLGLTSTNFVLTPNDISEPPVAQNLTWWPPGFTLIVAALLVTGLPLFVVLKTIYVPVTLIGWLGWSVIASYFFARPLTIKGKRFPLNLILVALLPIFLTPLWNGTDIFLWAGAPIVFLCLTKRGDVKSRFKYVALAGLVFGFLCAIRYASLFIGITAVLILFQLNYPAIKSFVQRVAVFIAASGICILPTVLYVKQLSQGGDAVPDVIAVGTPNLKFVIVATLEASRVVSNLIFGVPVMEWVILALRSRALIMLAGAMCLLIVLVLPLIVARTSKKPLRKNLALSLSFLPLSLIIFLLAIALGSKSIFFGQKRYYLPISLCGVFIFYHLFVSLKGTRIVRTLAGMAILPMLVYLCLFLPRQTLSADKFARVVLLTLGYNNAKSDDISSTSIPITYPSFELYSLKENSRRKLAELKRDNPQAIFFVDDYGFYVYDNFKGGPVPGVDLRKFPDRKTTVWSNAYTSRTVRVFWVIDPKIENLIPTSQVKTIYFDPYEKTKIYASEFQSNARLSDISLAKQLKE